MSAICSSWKKRSIKITVHGSLTSFLRQKSGSTVPGTAWKNTGWWDIWRNAFAASTMSGWKPSRESGRENCRKPCSKRQRRKRFWSRFIRQACRSCCLPTINFHRILTSWSARWLRMPHRRKSMTSLFCTTTFLRKISIWFPWQPGTNRIYRFVSSEYANTSMRANYLSISTCP